MSASLENDLETNHHKNATDTLKRTPLYDLHVELGARFVPFTGYEMPVQYPAGIIAEHQHTREKAGLFDVSHMGQAVLKGPDHEAVSRALEALVPGAIASLGLGRMRYTLLLNDQGGIIDDLMVTRSLSEDDDGTLFLVVNAARKTEDYAYISENLPAGISIVPDEDRALIALQGPASVEVLSAKCPKAASLGFMRATSAEFDGIDCHVSRSGYTGEDGFEISVPAKNVATIARALLDHPDVAPIGLGARDSLRLEAGLSLYGHDIDETTSPVEADLAWTIGKARRQAGGFAGADRILRELAEGTGRLKVGIKPEGRAPAREGTVVQNCEGREIGRITSGGYGPTFGGPVAMGYVEAGFAAGGTELRLIVRGKPHSTKVASLPFVPHRFYRAKKV
ncbi:aminomethyltransferase [bacterium MnTg02]|nr:aminomethyltransferase [bacterium MnTg02]